MAKVKDIDIKVKVNTEWHGHPGSWEAIAATHFPPIVDGGEQTGGRTLTEAEEVIKNGHPPMANKTILIDFDGTIYPFGFLFDAVAPIEGAKEFLIARKTEGYKIGIFTSRLSKRWLASVNQTKKQHIKYIRTSLKRDGIPFDFITAEKLPSEFYVDDKAAPFSGDWKITENWYKNRS